MKDFFAVWRDVVPSILPPRDRSVHMDVFGMSSIASVAPIGRLERRKVWLRVRVPGSLIGASVAFSIASFLLVVDPAIAAVSFNKQNKVVIVSNGNIRLGIDLNKGGSLSFLSTLHGENLINDHDLGRQVQASFYSGPRPFGNPAPQWSNWGWNPIQSGDFFGNRSRVQIWRVSRNTVYTKTIPLQWALRNVPCECTFETWTTLSEDRVRVQTIIRNHRSDNTQYDANLQELPAVYAVGRLRHLVTYTGKRPFSGQAAEEIPGVFPWTNWLATEGWSAYVDDTGFGLGVISPNAQAFSGGFSGVPKNGGAREEQTGYIAPNLTEILDSNIAYRSDVTLVVGNIQEIRRVAEQVAGRDKRPDYLFQHDRQHWTYVNAKDAGWPVRGQLSISTSSPDPQLWSAKRAFAAAATPMLFVTAAFNGRGSDAQFFWTTFGEAGFSERNSLHFQVMPDGKYHSYALPLAGRAGWIGMITQIRLDPPSGGSDGRMLLCSISWKRRPCELQYPSKP